MIKISTCGCSANTRPERGCKQLFCRRLSLPPSACWAEWWRRWVSVFFSRQICLIHQALLVLINVVLICILNASSHLRIGMIRETRFEIRMAELTFCVHLMDVKSSQLWYFVCTSTYRVPEVLGRMHVGTRHDSACFIDLAAMSSF